MAVIKEFGNVYYLVKKHHRKNKLEWTTIFPVRATDKNVGYININHIISTPKELVGKKIRFKVEVVEDERNRKRQG